MSRYDHLFKLAAAALIAGLFFYVPRGQAAEVQVFPPQLPPPATAGTLCPPNPSGYTYALIWDGVHNVECSEVPVACAAGQGLQFNGSNFICVTPCAGPVVSQQNVQACPGGQAGQIYTQVTTQCDGSTSSMSMNTCGIIVPAVSAISCNIGQSLFGYYDSGLFSTQCDATTPCANYSCTAGGLVPE